MLQPNWFRRWSRYWRRWGNDASAGATGTCSIAGAGIYIDIASGNNNIENCECNTNNIGNMCSNIGGIGGYSPTAARGGGAAVGGGGGAFFGNGGTGICLITGGGITINSATNNSITSCVCNNNNLGNLDYDIGGTSVAGLGNGGGGGAAVGGGGGDNAGGANTGGIGTVTLIGGGIFVNNAQNNTINSCTCSTNNINNFDYNIGGTGAVGTVGSSGGGGAAVGGGAGGFDEPGGLGTCSIVGSGILINNASTGNNINGCECNNNNNNNFCINKGGAGAATSGGTPGGGGAGVGGGGGGYGYTGGTGSCFITGGGIFIYNASTNNSINGSLCNNNNTSNLCTNTGGPGGTGGGGAGAGVGGGGGGGTVNAGGAATCYTFGGGICFDGSSNGNSIDDSICITNNTGNLSGNSNVGNGYNGSVSTGGIGICYTDGAGIELGAASCNIVNACELTANALSGVQLGSGYAQADNTLVDNVIMDCAINGAASCGSISTVNGIVTYGSSSPVNLIQNNMVKYCTQAYSATTNSNDIFASNVAKTNLNPYSSNITYTAIGGSLNYAGVNLTVPVNLLQLIAQPATAITLVYSLGWNPASTYLAVGASNGSYDLKAYSWNGTSLSLTQSVNYLADVYSVAWNLMEHLWL